VSRVSLIVRGLSSAIALLSVGIVANGWTGLGSRPAGAATPMAPANGQGSTYASEAFQEWTQQAQNQGLSVNYTATNSPAGLEAYAENTADFAGTEAEYSSLTSGGVPVNVPRGYEYTPDVAGATAIMYHVALNADGSDPVDYLHLSELTVAKIFLGVITNWDDPEISMDNKGLVLPNKHIIIDFRTGQSGTTALFYDFVKQTDPTDFATWAAQNGFSTDARILEVDTGPMFGGPYASGWGSSDQQAEQIASQSGEWSIGYDEFAFALTYNDDVAWIENASGNWVQPYAVNIAAALQSAVLAPDTSQNLDGVYTSTNPAAYPISAYSYILVQCGPTPSRATCVTPYTNAGVMNTMAQFMQYVACAGQITMANIGYSPLPPQLSQFLSNAIGWMTGQPPLELTATNCANPQFQGGSLGVGATPPPDPTRGAGVEGPGPTASSSGSSVAGAAGGATGATSTGVGASTAAGSASTAHSSTTVADGPGTGVRGAATRSVGGGSTSWLRPRPVAYVGLAEASTPPWPFLALLLALFIPVALLSVRRRRRRPTEGSR
jgi:phosphate transport system substrate-binding protein